MQFIKLTGSTSGKTIMVPKDRVMSIAQGEDSTEVFVDGMSQVYTILPWHVKETPEEIMRLIEQSECCRVHDMNNGVFCIKCGATMEQIIGQ